jgi:hypothetical protein
MYSPGVNLEHLSDPRLYGQDFRKYAEQPDYRDYIHTNYVIPMPIYSWNMGIQRRWSLSY